MDTLWVFDNDGTLYENVRSIEEAVDYLILKYIASQLKVSVNAANTLRKTWLTKHRTTSTLVAVKNEGYSVKELISCSYLTVDLSRHLHVDYGLQHTLRRLKGTKVILTNNPKEYALRVAKQLGVHWFFKKIYGIKEIRFILKPNPGAFIPVAPMRKDFSEVIFVDDSPENIAVAKSIGFTTVLVGTAKPLANSADRHIMHLNEL